VTGRASCIAVQIVKCADVDAALRTPSRSSALILAAQQTPMSWNSSCPC